MDPKQHQFQQAHEAALATSQDQHHVEEEEEEEEEDDEIDWSTPSKPTPQVSHLVDPLAAVSPPATAYVAPVLSEEDIRQLISAELQHLQAQSSKFQSVQKATKATAHLEGILAHAKKQREAADELLRKADADLQHMDSEIWKLETAILDKDYLQNPNRANTALKGLREKRQQAVDYYLGTCANLVVGEETMAAEMLAEVDALLKETQGDPDTAKWLQGHADDIDSEMKRKKAEQQAKREREKDLATRRAKGIETYKKSADAAEDEMQRHRNAVIAMKASKAGEELEARIKEEERKALENVKSAEERAKQVLQGEQREVERIRQEIRDREERERQARLLEEERRRQEEAERKKKLEEELRRLKEEQERAVKLVSRVEVVLHDKEPRGPLRERIEKSPSGSTTVFSGQIERNADGKPVLVVCSKINEPYLPQSYGEFVVNFYNSDGSLLLSKPLVVEPEKKIQVPQSLELLSEEGVPVPSRVYLHAIQGSTWNNLLNGNTDEAGRILLPPNLPDGSYLLGIVPDKPELGAREIKLVRAMGLAPEKASFVVPKAVKAFNPSAGTSMDPNVKRDAHGNAIGENHSLVKKEGLRGLKIALVILYPDSYSKLEAELRRIGLEVVKWMGVPPLGDFKVALSTCCQLWIISTSHTSLTHDHTQAIEVYWKQGNGVFIWGDNEPFYADANVLANLLVKSPGMHGNVPGTQMVSITNSLTRPGFLSHEITTGLQSIYEGITISTITLSQGLEPLMNGSATNLVTACYDQDRRRLVMDTGFTRLFDMFWNTAGTPMFVSNAAGWLSNLAVKRPQIAALSK